MIWTVEQGHYEGMGEPVITLHGVIWTVEQGRCAEGRNRSSAIWRSVLRFFTAPSCEHLWAPVQGVGEGDQSMGVARVHSCVRAWYSDVMWHFVCV